MIKLSAYLCFCLAVALNCFASTLEPPQPLHLNRFAAGLEIAKSEGHNLVLTKWSDIEALPLDIQLRMLGTHVQNLPNVSDYFSIVPVGERAKFPHGNLLIISAGAFDLTAFLRQWYKRDRGYTSDQLKDFDQNHAKAEVIRWYLSQDEEGKYKRASITEEELTKIIEQTGLKIPEPARYRFNMSQVDPATGKPIDAPSSPSTPAVSSGAESVATPSQQPVPASTQPTKQPANLVWCIVGLIILAAGVVFVTRKKKPKT